MNDASSFTKLVPGFDFLQGLVKNAGAALPGIGQWVAPTLDPAELEKRISELRTVQYWLEQNARMLATTIQALEVQKMTLSTLKTMNVQMDDLRESLKLKPPAEATSPAPAASAASAASRTRKPAAATPAGVVDPMQWWGALTNQFAQLATTAMKDTATDAAKNLAGAMMKQGMDAAGETLKKAVKVPAGVAAKAMSAATQAASATGAKAAAKKAAFPTQAAAPSKPAARKAPARKAAAKSAKAAKPRAS